MIKRLTENEIEALADGALNQACRYVQDAIGQTDGGPAALFFSGDEGENIHQSFISYINYEQLAADSHVPGRAPDDLTTIDTSTHRATTTLIEFYKGGDCLGLHAKFPYANNAHVMVRDGDRKVGLPDDPENGSLEIGAYNEANPEGKQIVVQGRKGLNDWYESNVGYSPDQDAGKPLPIMELMAAVAEMFYLHTYGDGAT